MQVFLQLVGFSDAIASMHPIPFVPFCLYWYCYDILLGLF